MGKQKNTPVTLSKPERFAQEVNVMFSGAVDALAAYMSKQKNAAYDKSKVAASIANARIALRKYGTISKYDHCLAMVTAVYAFQKTKQILRVDPTLGAAIAKSVDEAGEIPCSILMNMPYQGFFLEMPETETSTIGVFVHMDYGNYDDGKPCYSIWLNLNVYEGDDYAANDIGLIINVPLIEGKSLKEAVCESFTASDAEFDRLMKREGTKPVDAESFAKEWMTIVNILLYICSVNADIIPDEVLLNPKPQTTDVSNNSFEIAPKTQAKQKKTASQDKAKKQPKVWDVGFRIGAELRKHEPADANRVEGNNASGGKGGTKRTHMRRGHFHHYWVGSEKNDTRHLIVKWIPPIVVHAEYANELPVVMHDVR